MFRSIVKYVFILIGILIFSSGVQAQKNVFPDEIEFAVLKNIYESLGSSGSTNKTKWPANNNTNPDGANEYIESQYTFNVHGAGKSLEEEIIARKMDSSGSLEREPAVTDTISPTILEFSLCSSSEAVESIKSSAN